MNVSFHSHHGSNIVLSNNSTVAYRFESFAHGLTFSEKPLLPGELFLVEITKTEKAWSGHMRIGLTLIARNAILGNKRLPQYALPDLATSGQSWIFPIAKAPKRALVEIVNHVVDGPPVVQPTTSALGDGLVFHTPRGTFSKSVLLPILNEDMADEAAQMPNDVGSRIGVIFIPTVDECAEEPNMAEMHLIINGVDKGPYAKNIPYTRGNLHVVVDVYGTTKEVEIIQLYGVKTLQIACRDTILANINGSVKSLPLPKAMKDFLLS